MGEGLVQPSSPTRHAEPHHGNWHWTRRTQEVLCSILACPIHNGLEEFHDNLGNGKLAEGHRQAIGRMR